MPFHRRARLVATAAGVALVLMLGLALVSSGSVTLVPSFVPGLAQTGVQGPHRPSLLPVPLVSQAQSWTCGPAALMATLLYFGVFDDPESRLDQELGATPDEGTPVVRMVDEARRFGLSAEARTGLTLADLDQVISRGDLVIVALQAWAPRPVSDWRAHWEDGHYVVIVGLDSQRVYVMDPSIRTGYGYLPRDQFLERWHDYDREDARLVVYDRLGIVIRGERGLARYPADPIPVE
jgi:predicted double-glycine peptidase